MKKGKVVRLRSKAYKDSAKEQRITAKISQLGALVRSGKVDVGRLDKALSEELPILHFKKVSAKSMTKS